MPKVKRNRRPRPRREPAASGLASCAEWLMREVVPFLRRSRRPPGPSARHLRNAAVEVLEAMRALLDETIDWLRSEKASPELRRIRVED